MVAKRFDGLQIERASDEILALKPGAAQAYALNQTAAIVFDLCDGGHSKLEMATAIQHHTGLPADEKVVDLALDALVDAGLVAFDGAPPEVSISRRALIQRLSLSAATVALLPVVQPIMREPAAAASSPHPGTQLAQGRPPGVGGGRPPGVGGGPPPGVGGGPPPGVGGGRPPGVGGGPPPGR
jgi:Coenzyme PQQ synthesis protein D (PqqD)